MTVPFRCPRCLAPLAADGRLCSRCRWPRRLQAREWLPLALLGLLFPPLGLLLSSYALFLSDPFEKRRGRCGCLWAAGGLLLWFLAQTWGWL
jgi:hypothetical protein